MSNEGAGDFHGCWASEWSTTMIVRLGGLIVRKGWLRTSGDSSQRLTTPVAQRQTARPLRVLRTHLHAYACRIYVTMFRASTGLCRYWPAHPAVTPLSARCSSGQRFACIFLQTPPRDGHPCRSANTSPCRVCRGLAPPSECALPGAPKGSPRLCRGYFHMRNSLAGSDSHSACVRELLACSGL